MSRPRQTGPAFPLRRALRCLQPTDDGSRPWGIARARAARGSRTPGPATLRRSSPGSAVEEHVKEDRLHLGLDDGLADLILGLVQQVIPLLVEIVAEELT